MSQHSDHREPPGPGPQTGGEPPPPPGTGSPTGTGSFFDAIRRAGLVRSEDRWIGGVGGGLAMRLGVDPLVVRGLLAVAVLLGGLGLVLYGLAWALLPEQRDGRIHLQQLFRGSFDIAVVGAFVVFAVGLSYPDRWHVGGWWGPTGGWWQGFLWISAVILVVVLIVSATSKDRPPRTGAVPPAPGPYGPYGPFPSTSGSSAPPPPAGSATPASTTSSTASGTTSSTAAGIGAASGARTDGPATPHGPAGAPPPPGGWAQGSYGGGPSFEGQPYGGSAYGGSAYGNASHGGPGAPVGPPAPAYYAPPPPRPVRQGPGAGLLGVVVALTLLTFAGLLYADRTGAFTGPVVLTAGAVGVVLLGVAIVVSGLRGRTSGALGGLAVVSVLVLLPMAALHSVDWNGAWEGDWDGEWATGSSVGEVSHVPEEVAVAEQGYSLGAGEARLDLTELPLDGPTVEVPVRVGAGEVTIVMPDGGAYDARISVLAGEVQWLDGPTSSGIGLGDRTYESAAVEDGARPDITLDISVGAGVVTVEEEP